MATLIDNKGLILSQDGNGTSTVTLENTWGVHLLLICVYSGSNPSGQISLDILPNAAATSGATLTGSRGVGIPTGAKTSTYEVLYYYVGEFQKLTLTMTSGKCDVYAQYIMRN